jgi:hypothetical protein
LVLVEVVDEVVVGEVFLELVEVVEVVVGWAFLLLVEVVEVVEVGVEVGLEVSGG